MGTIFEIDNFQSIKHSIIELSGFATVQGASNRGKTAVVRALRSILYNDWHPSYLRKGEKKCTLKLTFDVNINNVKQIIQIKPENSYRIVHWDGTEDGWYPKTGTSVPAEIRDMNFKLVKTERDDKFNMNFQGQLETLFLVGEASEVLVTSFINKVFDIQRYERALKNITSDAIKLNRKHGNAVTDLEVSNQKIADNSAKLSTVQEKLGYLKSTYNKFCVKEIDLSEVTEAIHNFSTAEKLSQEIIQDKLDLKELGKIHAMLQGYINQFANIRAISESEATISANESELANLSSDSEQVTAFQKVAHVYLGNLGTVKSQGQLIAEAMNEKDELKELINTRSTCSSFQIALHSYLENLGLVQSQAKFIAQVSTEDDQLKELNISQATCSTLSNLFGRQRDLSKKIAVISEATQDIRHSEMDLDTARTANEKATLSLAAITELEELYKDVVGMCPLCNSQYDEEHSHED